MQKLIAAYKADKSLKNAIALRRYEAKHPFGACLLGSEDLALLNAALAQAKGA